MKIRTCAALLIVLLASLLLSGCSAAKTIGTAEDAVEQRLEKVEKAAENAVEKAAENAVEKAAENAAQETGQPPAKPRGKIPTEDAASPAKQISSAEAQAIALNHAGLTADQVSYLRAEFDIDDQIHQYEIKFQAGHWEYEYEIHSETGKIMSFDKDD